MKAEFIYWKDEDFWLGYLDEYPDYHTQGKTLDELRLNLKDLFLELTSGAIPNVRKKGELEVAS
jgi:predicted RNase H-like HicB family nuclease